MGKASKWFRAVLGLKKLDPSPPSRHDETATRTKEKRRWSFVKSYREKDQTLHLHKRNATPNGQSSSVISSSQFEEDPNRHAIAVAAAKAAVVEKAVAAANAAAEAVRLMSSGRCVVTAYASGSRGWREDLAAVKIQSAFRGYLARRALRALKALVRLQALVRGHIRRNQMAKEAQCMQAIFRVQARACAGRIQISESSHSSSKSSHFHHHRGPPTPEKFEYAIQARSGNYEHSSMLKRTGSRSNGREIGDGEKTHASFNRSERLMEKSWEQRVPSTRTGSISVDDQKSDKILEVDTVKPHFTSKRRNLFHSSMHGLASDQYSYSFTTSKDSTTHQSVPSPSSGEVQSVTPLKFTREDEEVYRTAENSPQFYSASSRGASGRSPFTPSKSDGSASFLSGYSDYPNYMSYTESSKAKVRSLSAPKQRPQYERSSSAKRYSMNGLGEPRSSSAQRASTLRASFTSKAYPGSGRLDRLGMPIGQRY